jgi:hypothetical protein
MSQGMPTDPLKAAQVMELAEAGYTVSRAAQITGIPRPTASDIVNRHGRWGEVADRPVFIKLRHEQNSTIEALARKMAADSFVKAESKMSDASYYQLVVGGSILLDKARLLAGEPTQITEVVNTGNLELLAAKLSEAVQLRTQAKAEEIDITPGADAEKLGK